MVKTVFRLSVLVTIGLLCGTGYGDEEPPPLVAPAGMVLIPAGEYQMGSNDPVACKDEQPVHTVSIDAFFMDKYEVTNAQYKQFIDANPQWGKNCVNTNRRWQKDRHINTNIYCDHYAYHGGIYLHCWGGGPDDYFYLAAFYLAHWNGNDYPSGEANHPVRYVSWYAAMAYAQWAGKRLPTAAEWEYAARGGLVGKTYPWGDAIDIEKTNYRANGDDNTTPVGKYPPNGYGLYDMAGNVYEWCLDEYKKDFYFNSPRENPLSGANAVDVDWFIRNFRSVKTDRVLRGGSWNSVPRNLRVASRVWSAPTNAPGYGGFRCVRAQ